MRFAQILSHLGLRVGPRLIATRSPRKESRARHLQHPAHQLDRIVSPLLLDAGVLHRDSLAKNAVAFFRKSRSIRSVAFSALSCDISASSSLTERLVPPLADAPLRGLLVQFASVLAEIPSLRAAPATPRLPASNTACAL